MSQLPQIRELVSLFISEGADVNHQNAAGETPSWRAAEECCWETIPWTG
ncbi:hypothetical protein M5E88_14200 [Akkermansia muciniphila]|nr:hypothetical protein M5E88_14200 [Akkermansia muciniphila]